MEIFLHEIQYVILHVLYVSLMFTYRLLKMDTRLEQNVPPSDA